MYNERNISTLLPNGYVGAVCETDQIVDERGHLFGDGRHEICVVRVEAAAASPGRISAPASRTRSDVSRPRSDCTTDAQQAT